MLTEAYPPRGFDKLIYGHNVQRISVLVMEEHLLLNMVHGKMTGNPLLEVNIGNGGWDLCIGGRVS